MILAAARTLAQAEFLTGAGPAAVGDLRAQCALRLKDWNLPEESADAVLLTVSELLTNALRHAGAEVFDLRLVLAQAGEATHLPGAPDDRLPDSWVLEVACTDTRPDLAPRRAAASASDVLAESGNGIGIIEHVADVWGVTFGSAFKSVYARFNILSRHPAPGPMPAVLAAAPSR